jgi:hypothetical protein
MKNWTDFELIIIGGVEYVDTPQAADYLGCAEVTLKRHAADKRILPDRVFGCTNLYTRATLDNFRPNLRERGRQPKEA